ncbi:MAG: hypothetical protein JWM91_4650 [Rhodospirillales bacterium]|nr:hypothetical protein [Rhodospirillales bacterium]
MRPTVAEQLEGLSRILSEIVAPEVTSAYPAEILRGAIGALNALGASWVKVPAFLAWDIDATADVLRTAVSLLADPLADEVRNALSHPADPTDWVALEDRQQQLRGLLVRAMPAILVEPVGGEAYRLMTALFRERSERFPFQMSAQPVKKT